MHWEHEKSCQDWKTILEIWLQLRTFVALHVFSLGPHADLNLFLWKQHSRYCGHSLWFFLKKHHPSIHDFKERFTRFTEIIYMVLQTVPSSQKKSFPLKQHQMSKTNFKVHMKVLSKLPLKWNWWWNFTCVCTISLNFEIYFVEFTWEIVFCVVSDNCFRKCKKDSV